jgi:hypothetical protein
MLFRVKPLLYGHILSPLDAIRCLYLAGSLNYTLVSFQYALFRPDSAIVTEGNVAMTNKPDMDGQAGLRHIPIVYQVVSIAYLSSNEGAGYEKSAVF